MIKLSLSLLVLFISIAYAHDPVLSNSYPTGAQQGKTIKLTCTGQRLQHARTLLFYKPGIKVGKPEIIDHKKVVFPLTVSDKAALGEHTFRILCDDGISYQRSLWIGPYPITYEKKEDNNSPSTAQKITINHTISGMVKAEDIDYYKISLDKDQIISLELEGVRLGKTFYDPYLEIRNSNHQLVAKSDDTLLHRQDPSLSFKAPAKGEYYLIIRDATYQGNNSASYRLHVGDFILPVSIYPLGAQRGKPNTFKIEQAYSPPITQTITPKQAGDTCFITARTAGKQAISSIPVRLTDFGFIQEVEPTKPKDFNHLGTNKPPTAPIAFHGTIQQPNDTDWFLFRAKKGQSIRVQVYANSLLSPLDPVIHIHNKDRKYIAGNGDLTRGQWDGRFDYKIPADGNYYLFIQDELKRGSPQYHYRIELTLQKPSLQARFLDINIRESQKWKAFNIPQGNSVTHQINLARTRVKDPLKVIATKLPKGIRVRALKMSKNSSALLLHLTADKKAPISGGLYPLKITSPESKKLTPIITRVTPVHYGNNIPIYAQQSDQTAIAVTKPALASIELVQPTQPIVQNGTLAITIRAHRAKEFKGDLYLQAPWKPNGISAPYSIKLPRDKTEITLNIAANGNAALGKWDFCIRAHFNEKTGPVFISSNIIQIQVVPPYLKGKTSLTTTTQGKNTHIKLTLEHLTPFNGKAKLTLIGLPDGITATPVEITKDTKEINIPITVPANARKGRHGNLFCLVNLPAKAGKILPHKIALGSTLRVNAPKKSPTKQSKPRKTNPSPIKNPKTK